MIEIKVGDKVSLPDENVVYNVIHINGEQAWISNDDGGFITDVKYLVKRDIYTVKYYDDFYSFEHESPDRCDTYYETKDVVIDWDALDNDRYIVLETIKARK